MLIWPSGKAFVLYTTSFFCSKLLLLLLGATTTTAQDKVRVYHHHHHHRERFQTSARLRFVLRPREIRFLSVGVQTFRRLPSRTKARL